MGGLTVLRALRQALPDESFVYLGDTARLPYGTKSADTVTRYALNATARLMSIGIKSLVVACNTASATALPAIEQRFADLPITGVVSPGAIAAAARVTDRQAVALLATEGTVSGHAYQRALLSHGVKRVYARPASLLVTLAEEGRLRDQLARSIVADYLAGLDDRAAVVLLGCTHFPVFADLCRELTGLEVVDSAATTARVVASENVPTSASPGTLRLLATDGAARFKRVGAHFLGEAIDTVEVIDL